MFGVTPGSSARIHQSGLDARALDALLDVVDEDLRELVFVAVHQRLGQVLVGVDARCEHDVETALVGHPLAEVRVAVENIALGSTTVRTPWP